MPSVGQELLHTPFPEMVAKLAMGIAQAQQALDENSVNTAVILADTDIDVVLNITQVIAADGTVSFQQADSVSIALIQIGLIPTFHQFSEATIEVTAKVGFAAWSEMYSTTASSVKRCRERALSSPGKAAC